MRPALRRTVLATACLLSLVLAGCGRHVAADAPITFVPADTPYVFANFKGTPEAVRAAWDQGNDSMLPARIRQLGRIATLVNDRDPTLAKVIEAVEAELSGVTSGQALAKTIGLSPTALHAFYGVGDVPVWRSELASPDAFKAFWARVEKRAGITAPMKTLDKQAYWALGGDSAKLQLLVAIEGKQVVATLAPPRADPALLRQLLGLTKPSRNASDRLARIDGEHGYGDYGSGYLDLPRLIANWFNAKDAVTRNLANALGASFDHPACAGEFTELAEQMPLATVGFQTYTAQEVRVSLDVQLSPALAGALAALKQPVPGMDEAHDASMFDLVVALPYEKWQTFVQARAKAAMQKKHQCPALQPLDRLAGRAANPPVQVPPEATSLLGVRLALDQWGSGQPPAGRVLVASSNPAQLVQAIQQTLPQFALKTIPTNGTPVAFELPPRMQGMVGTTQGWIAANAGGIAMGIGDDEQSKLAGTLAAPAGNGDRLLRMHFDGKMYGALATLMGRFAAMAPAQSQSQIQQQVATFQRMEKIVGYGDITVELGRKGLHFEADARHR